MSLRASDLLAELRARGARVWLQRGELRVDSDTPLPAELASAVERGQSELARVLRGATVDDRSIDSLISRLRRKLEPDPANPRYVQTVWGAGYRFGES